MMSEAELDEILTVRWPALVRRAMIDGDQWTRTFVLSIARQGKRRSWKPSRKQAEIMRRLLADLAQHDGDASDLIDEQDGGTRKTA